MKRLLSLLLLISTFCQAQNYQCLQSGVKHYFTNSNGYLRGIRIDSVMMYADSVVYYPFQTPRGPVSSSGFSVGPLDYHSGSWLGKRVLQYTDGSFHFDNNRNRKTIIKTQASVGDSWVFYQDSTTHFYQASVLAVDTMTVLGSVDSVKTILITAMDTSGIDTGDPANGYQIVVSKNYGFVQIFDLFTFPYVESTSSFITNDYYHEICGSQIFHLIHFHNPQMGEIYDYAPGDFYEYHFERTDVYGYDEYYGYHSDYVVSKTFIDSTHSSITFKQKTWTRTRYSSYGSYTDAIADTIITLNVYSDPHLLIDSSLMPEENGQSSYYYYYPGYDPTCYLSDSYEIVSGELFNTFEPCGEAHYYKMGMSEPQTVICYNPPSDRYRSNLIYSVKNGVSCGSYAYFPSAVNNLQSPSSTIVLSPNPATTELTVTSTAKITSLTVSNVLGQMVYSHEHNAEKVQVDVADLPKGIYLIKINGSETRKFVKE